jgi:hypothetical protein
MTFRSLRDFHDIMVRAYVRNLMFFVGLPCHWAAEIRRGRADQGALHKRSPRIAQRREDVRWLR